MKKDSYIIDLKGNFKNNGSKKNLFFQKIEKITVVLLLIIIIVIIIVKLIFKRSSNIPIQKFSNYIHLALNIDNKYVYPCIVTLTSLLSNKEKSTFYIIHILIGNDIDNNTFYKINTTLKHISTDSSNVTFYNMGDQFQGATIGDYITTAAYYRIALPSLLQYVDKIIYIDSDIIIFKDLREMYNIELKKDKYFCGILDFIHLINELSKLGVYTDKYMNSGVLLMNLKAMRKNRIENKIRDYISNHFLEHNKQTAINAVCYNNIQILSLKYASFVFNSYEDLIKYNNEQKDIYKYNGTELNQSFYEPTLIHFPGIIKPYEKKCRSIQKIYWWYYVKKSIFYKEILEYYRYTNEEVEDLINKIPFDGGLIKRKYEKI